MKTFISTTDILETKRCLVHLKDTKITVLKHNEKYLAMEAICPHSGGPLYLGDIEDTGNDCSLVCPWHAYRFSFQNGKSLDDDLFETKVYDVLVEDGRVYLEVDDVLDISTFECQKGSRRGKVDSTPNVVYEETPETSERCTLVDWAVHILNTPDPTEKVEKTFKAAQLWFDGQLEIGSTTKTPDRPARHELLEIVDRTKTKKRGKGGTVESRIAILHALANVEQWAIDLAWDIISRYSDTTFTEDGVIHRLPREFFDDFVQVAKEEATHFSFLVERIEDMGGFYGSLPVHDGLWDSAVLTSKSVETRLAIVHMVHEARGLDVNPSTILKFENAKDMKSVEYLTKIHQDEIGHVFRGQKWFSWICDVTKRDKYTEFHKIVKELFFGPLRPPFNEEDRRKAGIDERYYLPLADNSLIK